jgi:hypothetical protein
MLVFAIFFGQGKNAGDERKPVTSEQTPYTHNLDTAGRQCGPRKKRPRLRRQSKRVAAAGLSGRLIMADQV